MDKVLRDALIAKLTDYINQYIEWESNKKEAKYPVLGRLVLDPLSKVVQNCVRKKIPLIAEFLLSKNLSV